MIEIKNRTNGPISLVVKSFSERRKHTKAMTSLFIPARGKVIVKDERIIGIYLERAKKLGLLSDRYIPDTEYKLIEEN